MNKITTRGSSKAGADKLTYYRCTGTGSQRKGCGNMVRMEVTDAAVNEIMATTFRVPVKRLILVKGTDYQDQLEEVSYRIRALLDPDLMSDEQYDAELRRLRAGRDRLKALPAEPDRWEEQLTGNLYSDIYLALPVPERGAWLTSPGIHMPSNRLPQPGQSSGEWSVILILGRSSPLPESRGTGAAAAAVPGWLASRVPVSRCGADSLARMI